MMRHKLLIVRMPVGVVNFSRVMNNHIRVFVWRRVGRWRVGNHGGLALVFTDRVSGHLLKLADELKQVFI